MYDLYDLRPAVTVVTGAAARTRRARGKLACACDGSRVQWNAQPRGRGDAGAATEPAVGLLLMPGITRGRRGIGVVGRQRGGRRGGPEWPGASSGTRPLRECDCEMGLRPRRPRAGTSPS